jgi:hypothetical protein
MKYEVFVDDNFHHADEEERYKLGEFETCEAAVAACKAIVEEYLSGDHTYETADDLYRSYTLFGEDPWIASDDGDCHFSAWDYAETRCAELRSAHIL